jgi:hypothetical protein
MLRISYTMAAVATLLLLQAPSIFAAEYSQKAILAANGESVSEYTKNDEIPQVAASTFQGESDELAHDDPAMQQQPVQSAPASAAITMEYPALALLAMAIISMAALSRRDSFRIDR